MRKKRAVKQDQKERQDIEESEAIEQELRPWAVKPGKRLRFFLVCIIFLMVGLAGKLAFIQIVDSEKYVSVAGRQQRIALEGVDKRGTIYDRNLTPLTGTEEEYVYLIKKTDLDVEAMHTLSRMEARRLSGKSDRYALYCCAAYNKADSEWLQQERNAFILRTPQRYSSNQTAVHVLGYVSGRDGEGVCGLEKDFDDWLSQRDKVVYAVGDGANYIVPGMGIRNSTGRDCGLVITLESRIQKRAENILKEEEAQGAIVVAAVESGEILACASTPTFNPNAVSSYLSGNGREFLNLATQGLYPPGSVFKIAVAAAALEKGVADEETVFECKGYEEINGIRIKCSTGGEKGHGTLKFREAFVKSCNSAFIQLGQMVSAEEILATSTVLGLNEKTLTGISGEREGYLPKLDEVQGAGIGNLSIGQGRLSVTPMEICQMTQIVANEGKKTGLVLARGTVENGMVRALDGKDETRVLSVQTAELLQSFMVDTVKRGTANNLKDVSAGGKTGSAEAASGGQEVVHGWFTGFLPAENPKYVVTVLVEQGGSGRASAVPLFQKMAEGLQGVN